MFTSCLLRALAGAALALLLATAAVTVIRTAAPAAAAGDCTADPALDSEEQLFLQLINTYRAQNSVPPLSASYTLSKAAQWKSADLPAKDYFAHDDYTSAGGTVWRTWVQRIRDCGYGYNTWLGENIAAGNSGAQATFNQWKNSPGHNANMLNANYHTIGIGRAYLAGSDFGWYWTTEFGGYEDGWPSAPTPTPTATPDTTPPAASITAPGAGATVSGTVAFTASASDPSGIHKVRFWVDGAYLGYDLTAPYGKSWNTATYLNGTHTLKIEAIDWADNSTFVTRTVTVANTDNTPPTVAITAPAQGASVSGMATFAASASDGQGVQKVRFWVDGAYLGYDLSAPYSKSWNTSTYFSGVHTLKVEALDWANNSTIATITVTVANADSTPPSVTITGPASGATVSGTITLSANASDNAGVQKVRFWVDSVYFGYDLGAPYSTSWNTALFTNGTHIIRAQAVDWANNTTDATVVVTVSN